MSFNTFRYPYLLLFACEVISILDYYLYIYKLNNVIIDIHASLNKLNFFFITQLLVTV
jgi:hypothetical protein